MLVRSLVALLLSIPATVAIMGVLIAVTPSSNAISMSALILAFPVWVCVASASYITTRAGLAAAVLVAISVAGLGLVHVLRFMGAAGL